MTGKTESVQCWGCNVAYDGGGFCDECITDLQEQCVQDDVRLASYETQMMLCLVPVWTTEIMSSS